MACILFREKFRFPAKDGPDTFSELRGLSGLWTDHPVANFQVVGSFSGVVMLLRYNPNAVMLPSAIRFRKALPGPVYCDDLACFV
jgi:hypothetical protein